MISRELQLKMLNALKKGLLQETNFYLSQISNTSTLDVARFNIRYLTEHGLVQNGNAENTLNTWVTESAGPNIPPSDILVSGRLTAKGIDFLEDDGGLSAILGTVTVKLHADTIRDLIDSKIVESEAIPAQEKPALREALKGMKEEGLKQLTTRLISYGLDQGAITAQQLGQWLHS
ncbi:hypothetical protein [Halomonas sp. HAL1]|uniref:hypothetical protein n=1 Tax=Halomonas sp. HAL1 TaxID=550984 RepID=UPI00022D2B72|nr:hypothetical protein [Halomonas sp. HAL1]EHA14780.1 hypothetical protein HAL1_14462 [Halomonas sp. HAL1]WKV93315.1 hypothetical protein Q3Y66_01360 [Halomonas sp. HAL1]